MSYKILLIEDSPPIIKLVEDSLRSIAEVNSTLTLHEARKMLTENSYDLILLDLTLPDGDGVLFLNEIQSWPQLKNLPILILSGKGEVQTKVVTFNLGALDYIQKPFEPLELRARVESHLKRKNLVTNHLEAHGVRIEMDKMKASLFENNKYHELPLTQTEFKMLTMFVQKPEVVFSRDQILNYVWGSGTHVNDRTVDAHLSGLRKKLGMLGEQISSIRGVGYKFTPPAKNRAS